MSEKRNAKILKLITCLALSLLVLGPALTALAEVVHFKELMPFVDLKIPGWKMKGKPKGTTMKHAQIKMSEAKATYKSDGKTMKIQVLDFLGQQIPFLMMPQIEMESSEETVRTTEVQGFRAMETFRPQEKKGEINIAVAKRFLVKIDGKGIDNIQVLKDVAKQMDLKKLAGLAK